MKNKLIVLGIISLLALLFGVWTVGTILTKPHYQLVGDLPKNITGQSVEFQSPSGATLRGWFLPGKKGSGAILLLHGVRATRLSMLDRANFLNQAGYSVLLFDFQAHGESSGDQITFGQLESKDAQAAINFLKTTLPDEKIGLIGVSMGGAAAILASPKLEVNAMVLEQVYPTIERAITNRLTMRLGKWSKILTPLLLIQLKIRLGIHPDDLSPLRRISEIVVPKLLIAGANDQHTTLEDSNLLFQAASEPKELWIVDMARHVDLHKLLGKEYEKKILFFFEQKLRSSP